MTICPECYGVGEAAISCGFCGSYVCDDKQKLHEATKA
ncbi:unnamed protein product, partial [Adineta steineri]